MARYIILFFFFLSSLHAKIFETTQIEEILPYIDENTWVVFDIDDTLLESELQVGRSAWFYHEFERIVKQGVDKYQAVHKIDEEWFKVFDQCPFRTAEKETNPVVQKAKETGSAVFSLTSRKPDSAPYTFNQFEKLGIDFTRHAPAVSNLDPTIGHYEKGVVFKDLKISKGKALSLLLAACEKKPKKIVFVDDLIRHLQDAETDLTPLGIAFIGVHYRKTEDRPFDPLLAEQEYQQLKDNL